MNIINESKKGLSKIDVIIGNQYKKETKSNLSSAISKIKTKTKKFINAHKNKE